MYCENGILQKHYWTQDQCQDLCQQSPRCVGISYSPSKKSCYVCNDDILFPTAGDLNGYGFYRNPGIMGNHIFGLGSFLFIIICYGRTGFSRYKYNDDAKNTSKTDNLITSFNHDSRRYRYILVKIKMRWPRQPSFIHAPPLYEYSICFFHSTDLSHEEKCCKTKKVPTECFEFCVPAGEVSRRINRYGDSLLRYCTSFWNAIDQCKKGDNSLLLEYSMTSILFRFLMTLFNDIYVEASIFSSSFTRTKML